MINYTREDMELAYDEGYARAIWEEGSGGKEPLVFLEFMEKHWPIDETDTWLFHYTINDEQGTERFQAKTEADAHDKAFAWANEKRKNGILINHMHISKA